MQEQPKFLPEAECANREAGDVALCGADAALQLPPQAARRVGFAAPLGSRSHLDELLRTLHRHPAVRTLILCGDAGAPAEEALLALWREGLDARGQLPGSRGALSPDLDAMAVENLRRSVRIEDWRGRPLPDVARDVAGLQVLPRSRAWRMLRA